MTKEKFFKGELQEYVPEHCENDLLFDEERRIIQALNNQQSGIYRTSELGLTGLLCMEIYIGKRVKCQRKKVDELDNITVWKI